MAINNCAMCDHSKPKQGGHCYMFKTEPEGVCGQHTSRKMRVGTIGHVSRSTTALTAAIAAVLSEKMKG